MECSALQVSITIVLDFPTIQIKSFPFGSHIRSSDYLMLLNLDAFDRFNAT